MKFYTNDKGSFVENGAALIRVTEMHKENSKNDKVVRIFLVADVIKQADDCLIFPMQMIALSFPKAKGNSKSYTWKHGEKAMVKVNIDLHDAGKVEGDPIENN
jgi:hypothetical protein